MLLPGGAGPGARHLKSKRESSGKCAGVGSSVKAYDKDPVTVFDSCGPGDMVSELVVGRCVAGYSWSVQN